MVEEEDIESLWMLQTGLQTTKSSPSKYLFLSFGDSLFTLYFPSSIPRLAQGNLKSRSELRVDSLPTRSSPSPSAVSRKITVLNPKPSGVQSKTSSSAQSSPFPSVMLRRILGHDPKTSGVQSNASSSAQSSASPSPGTTMNPTHNQKGKQLPAFIGDNFNSVDEVTAALRQAGLESSNLILGIDFTKSNEWMGKYSFKGKCLHAIGSEPNPYEQAISIIGRTLSPFDEDNLIPCFGFGDVTTCDRNVFSFYRDGRSCHGFEEALARYTEIAPLLKLSGPTSFAPVIDAAINIVESSEGQYHVLVIIADGQVTRSSNLSPERLSSQEQETIDAIVAASHCPLSIVLVGVGDGPWDAMRKFDDNIPQRAFDNFQFVDFTKIMSENKDVHKKEAAFALVALMEIPFQYRATQDLEFPNKKSSRPLNKPHPPPIEVINHDNSVRSTTHYTSSSVELGVPVEQACPICLTNPKDMAFGCGHLTCKNCAQNVSTCPICRRPITTRVRLFA